jgi:hypothetical protein
MKLLTAQLSPTSLIGPAFAVCNMSAVVTMPVDIPAVLQRHCLGSPCDFPHSMVSAVSLQLILWIRTFCLILPDLLPTSPLVEFFLMNPTGLSLHPQVPAFV